MSGVLEISVAASFVVMIASAAVAILSLLSSVGNSRWREKRFFEVVRYNPTAATMALWSRAWPYALRVLLVSAVVFAVSVGVTKTFSLD